jgi:hypothetical protein
MEGLDEGINAEWIRIVRISREENVSIEEAEKIFKQRYFDKYGEEYGSE